MHPTPPSRLAAISFSRLTYRPVPGLDKVTAFSSESMVWGGVQGPTSININNSMISETYTPLYNASQHPGFSVQPVWWCSNPNNLTPVTAGFSVVDTSAGLADSLLQLSYKTRANDPAGISYATTVFPDILILERAVTAADVVQLASRLNASVTLSAPLILNGPPFPRVPGPANVSLDLSGCIGCMSLSNATMHLYLIDLHLTGLEQLPASRDSRRGGGSEFSLPLWAFQFDRLPGSPRVSLRNVTLTLPQQEFSLLLANLTPAPRPGEAGQQQQQLQPAVGWSLQVRPGGG